jgi:hypothetical protein
MRSGPSKAQRLEAMFEMAIVQARQGNYVSAVGAAFAIDPAELNLSQTRELLLLKSQILREMNLPERALAVLKSGLDGIKDADTASIIHLEIARCNVALGRDEEAMEIFAETVPHLPSGPQAHEAMCDMAEASLRLGKPDHAVSVLQELLRLKAEPATYRRASGVLGRAYLAKQDYEKAAVAFAGADKPPTGGQP